MKNLFLSLYLIGCIPFLCSAQRLPFQSDNIFKTHYLIENKGQFELMQSHMKQVDFAIHHRLDEAYINRNGFSFHITSSKKRTEKQEEELERGKQNHTALQESWIDFNWVGANADSKARAEGKSTHYFTYGPEKYISYGFEKVTYRNLYPGIDVVYQLNPKGGIEYTLILHPGADIEKVRFAYTGQRSLDVNVKASEIRIRDKYHQLIESAIHACYQDGEPVSLHYIKRGEHEIGFSSKDKIDQQKTLVIDPWVAPITTLVGVNATVANMGYDVDFDIYGNLYVMGGGGGTNSSTQAPQMAKYDASGNLAWTFPGNLVSPIWNSSPSAARSGNITVDKISSKVYMSQGGNFGGTGATIVRLKTNGIYDNFMSVGNMLMNEMWEMKFNCSNGKCMAIGGGTTSNLNFGLVDTTTGIVTTSNVTGQPNAGQDIVCATLDDNGEVYVIFAGNPLTSNQIYKLNSSFTAPIWNTPSGYTTMTEQGNKPFTGLSSYSNSYNCLGVNNTYVFYYDGLWLKAFLKSTGAPVGSAAMIPGLALKMQGGIYANNCNQVYIGGENGDILRYGFNGSSFTYETSIVFPGFTNKAVYDINYNPVNNLLYVSGNGFVATADPSTACVIQPTGSIQLSSSTYCPDSATVTVLNPDPGAAYSFVWVDSSTGTPIATNLTSPGIYVNGMGGLPVGDTIQVTAIKSSACQVQTSTISLVINCNTNQVFIDRCNGQSYTLPNGTIVNAPGVFVDTFVNSLGGDSIVHYHVNFHPVYHDTIHASICNGLPYLLPNGGTVFTAGMYTSSFQTSFNCDSIITTILSVKPVYNLTTNASICSNQAYTLPSGISTNLPGTYHDTLHTVAGCDSIIHTILTVNPSQSITYYDTICSDQTYTLPNGSTVQSTGTYTNLFTNVYSCDSEYIIHLTVHPVYQKTTNQQICQGGTYTLPNGQTVSLPGTYPNQFTSIHGCDSAITTILKVNQSSASTANPVICSDQFYTLPNGTNTNLPGTYTHTIQNAGGCDSTINTHLQVIPKPGLFLGKDTFLCRNESLFLNITTPNATYLWNDLSTEPIRQITAEGMYIAQVTVAPCGPVIDTIQISHCQCNVFIPNAFSPNNDGRNDFFKPMFTCYTNPENYLFKIFNRWGQEIFGTSIVNDGWDGTYREVEQNTGTYMYLVQYTDLESHKEILHKGDLTLIR